MKRDLVVGIDLGTSNSCVAVVVDGRPKVLPNAYGEPTTASVVAFAEDGTITVGNQAKARIILDPKHTVSSAKRLIGRYIFSEEVQKAKAVCRYEVVGDDKNGVRIRIRDEKFSLPEISAFVLGELKQISERALGQPIEKAVITVPAYFNDNQRQATKDAGRIAGLEVLRILNEPTAAALAYGYGKDLKQRVAVYDLGGGTFDVSVLEIDGDVFEVLSTCGDTYLGGDDFDDRLIDLLADQIQGHYKVNVRSDPFALEKLKAVAERAKIDLSENDTAHIEVKSILTTPEGPVGLFYELTRAEFEKLTMDLIIRTFKVCDEAMQNANLTVRDLDGVIMVGGPTRLPTIREAVTQYFGRTPELEINPDQVVAMGAAIHAASLGSADSDTFLLDVTPLSLRLGIAGGMTEPIIDRNSPVPIEQTRIFTPARDKQEMVSVEIYQGESRQAAGNELLGAFEFSGFVPAARDQVQIEVTFAISSEGIVKVSARDPKTGAHHSTSISMSSSLSEDDIKAIVERNRVADLAVVPATAAAAAVAAAPAPAPAERPTPQERPTPPGLSVPLPKRRTKTDEPTTNSAFKIGGAKEPRTPSKPLTPPKPLPSVAAPGRPSHAGGIEIEEEDDSLVIEEIEREAAARLAAQPAKKATGDEPDRSMFGSGDDDLHSERDRAEPAGLPDDALASLIAEELDSGTDDLTVPEGTDDTEIDLIEDDEIQIKD
jgi:molecular chaperone DnaK